MPASFLLNMSLDPASPLSRFEVINKNITESRSGSQSPKIIDQQISYRVTGPSTANFQTVGSSLDGRALSNFNTNAGSGFDEAAPVVNFQSTMSNRVTYRRALGTAANMKRS